MLRKGLIRLRREYNTRLVRLLTVSGSVFLVFAITGFLVDSFLPFAGWWNALRSGILIPLSLSMFILGYVLSIYLHRKKIEENPDWVPFRARFTLRWRRRIAAIAAAFLFVLVYGAGYSIFYTFVSSVFVAIAIALFAFIRPSREESLREELEIPDARDLKYDDRLAKVKAERERAKEEARRKSSRQKKDTEDD